MDSPRVGPKNDVYSWGPGSRARSAALSRCLLGRSQIYPVELKHAGTADAWTPVIIEAPLIDAGTAVHAARRSRTLDDRRGGTRPWPADQREAQTLWLVTSSSECYI